MWLDHIGKSRLYLSFCCFKILVRLTGYTLFLKYYRVATSRSARRWNEQFTTNGMCAKNSTYMHVARKSSDRVITVWRTVVACCHSVKLCAHAARTFRLQTQYKNNINNVFHLWRVLRFFLRKFSKDLFSLNWGRWSADKLSEPSTESFQIRGLYVCSGGLDILKFDKTSTDL